MKFSLWKFKSFAYKHNRTKNMNKKGAKQNVTKRNQKGKKNLRRKNKEFFIKKAKKKQHKEINTRKKERENQRFK